MQIWYRKNRFLFSVLAVLLLSALLLWLNGERNDIGSQKQDHANDTQNLGFESENYPAYIKFRSFQNSDSTWGFTIFLNSRPYLHYKKIPFKKAVSGFQSKKDADLVAGLFVKMIQSGDLTPELNKKVLDSLK